MVIKRSLGQEVAALVADLDADEEVRRESAIARLAVIGPRAMDRLLAVVGSTMPPRARQAALQALEAIGDPRALDHALRCLQEAHDGVRRAAVDVLRRLLRTEPGTATLDRLTALALDGSAAETARLAALDALGELPARTLEPVRERLHDDPSAEVRRKVATDRAHAAPDPLAEIEAAAAEGLPADPGAIRDLIIETAARIPLSTLHRLVVALRDREGADRSRERRAAWRVARGAAHRALADRDSRVALYDLRETLDQADAPLPVDYLAALERIGDPACLESIAAAYATAPPGDDVWKRHLAGTFQAIAFREHLTRRHQVIRRLRSRWPAAVDELLARKV